VSGRPSGGLKYSTLDFKFLSNLNKTTEGASIERSLSVYYKNV
jgi:hypothetical protein